MLGSLIDVGIWLAVTFVRHPAHTVAMRALQAMTPATPAYFCRATEISFLRLASTPAIHRAYSVEQVSNSDAIAALADLQSRSEVATIAEPPGIAALWPGLAARDTASPKMWMDAYMAAFAIAGGLNFVSLDRDFQQYTAQGLSVLLLTP